MLIWWERVRDLLSLRAHAHPDLPDLRDLGGELSRLERTHYLVNDPERELDGDRLYVLRREPASRRHPSTVAVYARGRNVGYLAELDADRMAPLLDDLGGSAIVSGVGSDAGSSRLWVRLPTDSEIRGRRAPAPQEASALAG